ncbi:aldehyde dehydrogenase [Candidatus Bipolaricaulota bacterium]|nr:aldehyde dehydrogenase [Candidatus Bipolaricaulota bacterium]
MDKTEMNMLINGKWVGGERDKRLEAESPATGEIIASLPRGTERDVDRAVRSARDYQPELSSQTAFYRAELCHAIAERMKSRKEELARWLSLDQGKPFQAEAFGEVDQAISHFTEAAEDAKRLETPVLPSEDPNKRIFTIREPHGVLGVITPWNFPLAIPSEYISAALATGNSIVWKPASTAPAIAVKLAECIHNAFEDQGLNSGAFNLVPGPGSTIGQAMVTHDKVDAIGLTGSPEVGERVASQSGLKKLLLELGGNGPVVVLEDADIEKAAQDSAFGSFYCAGQVCVASERILVHSSIKNKFLDLLVEEAKNVKLGPSLDEDTTMGPLNNEEVAQKMDRHIEDAVNKGAEVIYGGERAANYPTELYYQPTVLSNVTPDSLLNKEETFGPIAPVIEFETHDEALEIANGIDLGLVSSVFTTSLDNAIRFAEGIETGAVNINETSDHWEIHTPVGGYSGKRSGLGRIGGRWSLQEMTQVKCVNMDIGRDK